MGGVLTSRRHIRGRTQAQVEPAAAAGPVRPVTATQPVITRPAAQPVRAGLAPQVIVARPSADPVVTGFAADLVVTAPTAQSVFRQLERSAVPGDLRPDSTACLATFCWSSSLGPCSSSWVATAHGRTRSPLVPTDSGGMVPFPAMLAE